MKRYANHIIKTVLMQISPLWHSLCNEHVRNRNRSPVIYSFYCNFELPQHKDMKACVSPKYVKYFGISSSNGWRIPPDSNFVHANVNIWCVRSHINQENGVSVMFDKFIKINWSIIFQSISIQGYFPKSNMRKSLTRMFLRCARIEKLIIRMPSILSEENAKTIKHLGDVVVDKAVFQIPACFKEETG